jgi:hypothetical protein
LEHICGHYDQAATVALPGDRSKTHLIEHGAAGSYIVVGPQLQQAIVGDRLETVFDDEMPFIIPFPCPICQNEAPPVLSEQEYHHLPATKHQKKSSTSSIWEPIVSDVTTCRGQNDTKTLTRSPSRTPPGFRPLPLNGAVAAPQDSSPFPGSTSRRVSLADHESWSEDLQEAPSYRSVEAYPPSYGSHKREHQRHVSSQPCSQDSFSTLESFPISSTYAPPDIIAPQPTSPLVRFPVPVGSSSFPSPAARQRSVTLPAILSSWHSRNRTPISAPILDNINTRDIVQTLHDVITEHSAIMVDLVQKMLEVSQGLNRARELTEHLRRQQALIDSPVNQNSDATMRNQMRRISHAARTPHRLDSPCPAPQAPPSTPSTLLDRNEAKRIEQKYHALLRVMSPFQALIARTTGSEVNRIRNRERKWSLSAITPLPRPLVESGLSEASTARRHARLSDAIFGKPALVDFLNIVPTPISRGHTPHDPSASAASHTQVTIQPNKSKLQQHAHSTMLIPLNKTIRNSPVLRQQLKGLHKPELIRSTTQPGSTPQTKAQVRPPARPSTTIP